MTKSVPILEIQTGKHKGKKVRLSHDEVMVGRSETARIRIASEEVSREHCVLVPSDEGVLVRDLGSRNGTFIDGRPVQGERLLLPGGTLTVGPLTLVLLGDPPLKKDSAGSVRVAGKSTVEEQLSDDAIASWLTEGSEAEITFGDTAIIQKPGAPPAPGAPKSSEPPPKKREFKTVAEEAKDIIRRHFESLSKEAFEEG
ncbi:MAG: FHA domain-containing protein [Planctomycetaceae bacterium]|nr:FHA domain-containing protein [Planctomycetaceae bacterium]